MISYLCRCQRGIAGMEGGSDRQTNRSEEPSSDRNSGGTSQQPKVFNTLYIL